MTNAILSPSELAIFDFGRGFGMDVHSSEDIARTAEDLKKVKGGAVIVGGLAVIHFGYRRYTHDVDVLYSNHDEAALLKRLKKDFKVVLKAQNGWHHLEHKKTHVRLELIPEGGLTTYGFIPAPKTVGTDGDFISLLGLMWMKLVSGRSKDEADVVEIAKLRKREMKALAARLPSELQPKFAELLEQAERELANDPNRAPDNIDDSTEGDVAREAPAKYGKKQRVAKSRLEPARKAKRAVSR